MARLEMGGKVCVWGGGGAGEGRDEWPGWRCLFSVRTETFSVHLHSAGL